MAKSNAVKRLERILSDEDYGPKLARLNRKDEAYILDLIDKNKGREARKEILRLDVQRLERRRGSTTPRAAKLPTIEQLRAKAYTRLRQMLNGKPKTQQKGVSLMNTDQLNIALNADADTLRRKSAEYPDIDIEFNVFWYK
jgi:hypothetical protein